MSSQGYRTVTQANNMAQMMKDMGMCEDEKAMEEEEKAFPDEDGLEMGGDMECGEEENPKE
eukprot:7723071-Alexandrium_andersonii.AAC.1